MGNQRLDHLLSKENLSNAGSSLPILRSIRTIVRPQGQAIPPGSHREETKQKNDATQVAMLTAPLLLRKQEHECSRMLGVTRELGLMGSRDENHGGIAQLVERQLCKLEVTGSNPVASTNATGRVAQLVRARP